MYSLWLWIVDMEWGHVCSMDWDMEWGHVSSIYGLGVWKGDMYAVWIGDMMCYGMGTCM